MLFCSVADPGSGAFLTPGSRMGRKSASGSRMNNPNNIFYSLEIFLVVLGLKYLYSLMRIRDPGWRQIVSGIRDQHPGSATLLFWVMRPINKPPGSSAPQTSDEIYTCTKSYGAMNASDPVIIQPITCKLSCKNRNSYQIIPWKCWNIPYLSKMTFFGLKIRLLFTEICFGSGFESGFESGSKMFISDPDRIRIRPKVSDSNGSGSGSGSGSATLPGSKEKINHYFFLPAKVLSF